MDEHHGFLVVVIRPAKPDSEWASLAFFFSAYSLGRGSYSVGKVPGSEGSAGSGV